MSRRGDYLNHLSEVPMFSALNKKELRSLGKHSQEVDFPEGQVLVREGDVGDEFFVIVEGAAAVSRDGRQVAELGPGDYFGELALLDDAPRNATVTATKALTAVKLGKSDFESLITELPTIAFKLGTGLARRLREADEAALH